MATPPEIRAIVVDDEPLARRGVRQLLAPHPDIAVVAECRDGREALRALGALGPDLVFLDIEMPGLGGLDVVRAHGVERMPATVFVTAHAEFAVRAFEARALDYLVKPLGAARFDAAVARVRERLRLANAAALAERLRALIESVPAPEREPARFAIRTDDGHLLLDADEIDWIEADDDHSRLHAGGATHRIRESLAAIESRLDPERFARVHRSAIVRLDRIRELSLPATPGGEATIVLRDGTPIPVSRRRLANLKALL